MKDIKLCEYVKAEEQWEPVDSWEVIIPQPCCDNCSKGRLSECVNDNIYCKVLDDMFGEACYIPINSKFYCSFWKAKRRRNERQKDV